MPGPNRSSNPARGVEPKGNPSFHSAEDIIQLLHAVVPPAYSSEVGQRSRPIMDPCVLELPEGTKEYDDRRKIAHEDE